MSAFVVQPPCFRCATLGVGLRYLFEKTVWPSALTADGDKNNNERDSGNNAAGENGPKEAARRRSFAVDSTCLLLFAIGLLPTSLCPALPSSDLPHKAHRRHLSPSLLSTVIMPRVAERARKKAKTKAMYKPHPDDEKIAHWRSEPAKSYSDWKIVARVEKGEGTTPSGSASETDRSDSSDSEGEDIRVGGEKGSAPGKAEEYHVHRVNLAMGPRKSNYFDKLFQQEGFSESKTGTTELLLPEFAFDAFERFLDYMYGAKPHCVDRESAIPLLYLSDRFDAPQLADDVIAFMETDLGVAPSPLYQSDDREFKFVFYCRQSRTVFGSDRVYDLLRRKVLGIYCAHSRADYSSVLTETDLDFWMKLLAMGHIRRVFKSVASVQVCKHYGAAISVEQLKILLDAVAYSDFKYVHQRCDTLLELLKLEETVCGSPATGDATSFQLACVSHFASNMTISSASAALKGFIRERPQFAAALSK